MAETTVEVVVKGVGFEQLAAEAQRASEAIKKFGEATRSLKTGSLFGNVQRDFTQIETRLTELRRSFQITAEFARNKLGAGIGLGLSEALSSPSLITKYRERGEELGRAMRQGVQTALNAGGGIAPPMNGRGGGGSGRSQPGGTFRHVIDPIGGVIAGSVLGHATVRATESIFDQAGALAQVRAQLKAQGISDGEIDDVEGRSRSASGRYRGVSVPELMQNYGEARTVFPNADEAKNFIPISAELHQALLGLRRAHEWAKDIDVDQASLDLAKSLELLGVTNDPAKSRRDIDMMLKGVSAFKGQIGPADYNLAFRYARGALRGYDDDFLWTVLPTLAAEFKSRGGQAGPAGNALQSFYRSAVKGVMTNKQRDAWKGMGLLDQNGRTIDLDLARANPLEWWQKDVAPKLKGFDPQKQRDAISQMFPTAIPEQMGNIFNSDLVRLQKDAANVRAAAGLDDLNKLFENTPAQAMGEFSAQFKNLLAALGDPLMPAAIGTLKGLAGTFSSLTNFMHNNPVAGYGVASGALAGGGYLAYRLLPALLGSPAGRFAVGAISGGLLGGGLEALIFGGLLGASAPAAGGAAPGFARLRSVLGRTGSALGGLGTGALELGGAGIAVASARISKWISSIGLLKAVLGQIGRLVGLLGTLGMAYEVGSWAAHTQTGEAMLDTLGKELRAKWFGADASHGNAQVAKEAYWKSGNVARSAIGLGPTGASPSYLSTLLGDKVKYLDFAKNREWMQHIQPTQSESWVPSGFGARGHQPGLNRGSGGGSAGSGPIPVVITQMPKEQSRPNNITTSVTVNVQTNAAPAAIGGAVGSAVGSSVSNALSDQHH